MSGKLFFSNVGSLKSSIFRIRVIPKKCNNRRNFSDFGDVVVKPKVQIHLPRNGTLHELIWTNLGRFAKNVAVECAETSRSYTFEEVHRKSLATSKFLKDGLKLKYQDTACVVLPNLPEYPIALMGIIQAGLRMSSCNPGYTVDEIKRQIEDSDSLVVFTTNGLLPKVKGALQQLKKDIKLVVVNEKGGSGVTDGIDFSQVVSGDICDPVDINNQDVAILPYSSGTTGLPKGVELTYFNLFANILQSLQPEFAIQIESDGKVQDVMPGFLPFFHIYGLVMILLEALYRGNKIITMPTFNSETFIRVLKQHKPTILHAVPLVVNLMIHHPNITLKEISQFRTVICGAAPLGAEDVERFKEKSCEKTSLLQGYGMTETSPLTIIQTDKINNGIKTGGTGVLIANTEAKIVAPDGSSLIGLGPNISGELLVRGPQVMKGYFKNPKATAEILAGDGWLRTGDVAYYDEDEHFFITDRIKELIKVKGFQVAPAELEAILRSHPEVEDAAVIGVPHPTQDEAPKAFVVSKERTPAMASEIAEFVSGKVSKHKRLVGGVVFVDSIPKSASGKILRKELK